MLPLRVYINGAGLPGYMFVSVAKAPHNAGQDYFLMSLIIDNYQYTNSQRPPSDYTSRGNYIPVNSSLMWLI